MPTVVVRHDLDTAAHLKGRRDDLRVVAAEEDEVADALSDASMLLINNGSWRDDYLDSLDAGDWVQATSAGYEAFPLHALGERGVTLTNASGLNAPPVAEHVFAFALAFSKRLPELFDRQNRHVWDRSFGLELEDWSEKTATVLGLGSIGEAVATRALAFGMDVYGVKRTPDGYDGVLDRDRVVGPDGFDGCLPHTDLLVVTVPLTEETRHVVDRRTFERLPESAILVNVARGPVVDEAALLDALESGAITGAGLDVFETEPLPPDSPLWDHDDVLLTPHLAGRSAPFPRRVADLFCANYDRWLASDPLENRLV